MRDGTITHSDLAPGMIVWLCPDYCHEEDPIEYLNELDTRAVIIKAGSGLRYVYLVARGKETTSFPVEQRDVFYKTKDDAVRAQCKSDRIYAQTLSASIEKIESILQKE